MPVTYENSLYKGKVTLVFEGRRHRYIWQEKDKLVKSVTTALKIIAKPALIQWAANMSVEYMKKVIAPGQAYDEPELEEIWERARFAHKDKKVQAGKIGTILHKWVEQYINWKVKKIDPKTGKKQEKPELPVNKKLRKSCIKFKKWVKKNDVRFLVAEQVVLSKKYMYCGTTDFICKYKGKKYIGDLKTSSGIYPEMMIQASAYRHAREEEFPNEKYDGQLVIRIGREDGFLEVGFCRGKKNYRDHFKTFIYALYLSNMFEVIKDFVPDRQ